MSTFKFKQGEISNEELAKRTRKYNKQQFRAWSKKNSNVVALKCRTC